MYKFKLINLDENKVWLDYPSLEMAAVGLSKWRLEFPENNWGLQDENGYIIPTNEIVQALTRVQLFWQDKTKKYWTNK